MQHAYRLRSGTRLQPKLAISDRQRARIPAKARRADGRPKASLHKGDRSSNSEATRLIVVLFHNRLVSCFSVAFSSRISPMTRGFPA